MYFAWEAFLLRYRPMAHALARSLTGSGFDADDLVQEAFLAVLRAHGTDANRFESQAHARNYLLRTVRNLASQAARSRGRAVPFEEDEASADGRNPTRDALAKAAILERRETLSRLLGRLGSDELDLLIRRFSHGETLAQVARSTGVPISTLHSRERALLGRLREQLERSERERA